MKIIVDGVIFRLQKHGGISRIYQEILPRMFNNSKGKNLKILMPGTSLQTLPALDHLPHMMTSPKWCKHVKPLALRKLLVYFFEKIVMPLRLNSSSDSIWHSSYFTLPFGWRGKKIVEVYDLIHERYPEMFSGKANDAFRKKKKKAIEAADAIICISEATKKDVCRVYNVNAANVYAVPLAASEFFKNKPETNCKQDIKDNYFLYVGTRVAYKNYDFLLEAFAKWSLTNDSTKLIVVGPPLNKLEIEKISELKISARVINKSNVTDEELMRLYNNATAFIYPSEYEGFGIPILEAMACGCPVISSNIPTSKEVAGDAVLYFDLGDESRLIECLSDVIEDKRRESLIALGLKRYKLFTWDKTATGTLEVYDQVLGRGE